MEKKSVSAKILGCILVIAPIVTIYVINPIAKKTIKWVDIPEMDWIVYAMLAGLGASALIASRDVERNRMVFSAIFLTITLNIVIQIMFIYSKYNGEMVQAILRIIYLCIAAGLAKFSQIAKS